MGICVDVYKIYESNDFNKIYGTLSTLKNKKLKINITLLEKLEDILEKPHFEQDYNSRTATGVYEVSHDFIRLMK